MGLFKKFKKDDKMEEDVEIKIENDTQKREFENELEVLQEQIKEKNERLGTIKEKIQLSKKEYDEIVGKIIQTKKELRTQGSSESDTNDLVKRKNQDISRISKEISDSKIKLKQIQEKIAKNSELNKELEQKIKENEPFVLDSKIQKRKIDEELEQRERELEILKKKLVEINNTKTKNNVGDDSKSVVEAASQIVATANKRLHDTMKELDVIRQLLDKERKAHTETKKKLQN